MENQKYNFSKIGKKYSKTNIGKKLEKNVLIDKILKINYNKETNYYEKEKIKNSIVYYKNPIKFPDSKKKKISTVFENYNNKRYNNLKKFKNFGFLYFNNNVIESSDINIKKNFGTTKKDHNTESWRKFNAKNSKFSLHNKTKKLKFFGDSSNLSLSFDNFKGIKDTFIKEKKNTEIEFDLLKIEYKEKCNPKIKVKLDLENNNMSNDVSNYDCFKMNIIENEKNILKTPFFVRSFEFKKNNEKNLQEYFSLDNSSIYII